MNIAQAKEQIMNAMTAYFTKDELGNPRIPVEKQRPVFLIGPPGVGKTAIMEQIAAELGVGLVSYSMTHHTRQSALGLPYITEKEYEGFSYQVSEYTMSEIIGSVYELMRNTGLHEGILFLDEINCISETLAPCMLQFLQYKVFGQHQVPPGWIVVTAGNPPEYNKSVRDFDIVTWDRLKRIDVEPDYEAWKAYANKKGVHPAVMTYLSARKKDFYKVESTVDGRNFVTARSWDDLSEMIRLYEENSLKVDERLICQYLQDAKTAKEFAIYYDLFNKYRSDYKIEEIMDGRADEAIVFRASQAAIDERLSLLGLLFDAVTSKLRSVCEQEDVLDLLTAELKKIKEALPDREGKVSDLLEEHIAALEEKLESGRKASSMSAASRKSMQRAIARLEDFRAAAMRERAADFETVRTAFGTLVSDLKLLAGKAGAALEHSFGFCEKAFGDGDEILLFVTELTVNYYSARFIGHYGCDKYYLHNKELQFQERQQELIKRVNKMDWEW
ncbi:AAA family ATPase [Anaerovorax odorimutans]|uniref:AAA family ATPase n=1 Tax=Anaerovorax odorimutans TaxID=109327 RepID=A0ABT1RPC5_9FIRM|nr:MoxR family ATPase [Anaerovorax odorimutans]MCQ4637049.1 AAA family ATPase [Anaerovorax odorimutans]